jgi:GNAT superfamily N-acetyltransferase
LLRQATVADIAAMHRVRLAVRENVLTNPARVTEAHYLAAINERGRGWVIEAEGQILAFAFGDVTDGSIWALFVDPQHEGRGHGKRLQTVMLDWLWAQGLERLWLTTASGSRAEKFYAMTGWQSVGTTPDGDARFEMGRPAR